MLHKRYLSYNPSVSNYDQLLQSGSYRRKHKHGQKLKKQQPQLFEQFEGYFYHVMKKLNIQKRIILNMMISCKKDYLLLYWESH